MRYVKENDSEKLVLDLWGGQHVYYKKSKSYVILRDCGLFSNLTVMIYGVFVLYVHGYEIEDIRITMTDYFFDRDVYQILFKIKNEKLSFDDISNEEIDFFMSQCYPSTCGLGLKNWSNVSSNKENFNLKITNKIINKFFTPNENVLSLYEKMLNYKKIEDNDYVFIWARRTDKVEETSIPNAKRYFEVLEEMGLLNERIFIQTDDPTMVEEFNELSLNFEMFEQIPLAKGYSFHRSVSRTSDEDFINDYNVTKEEYMMQMFCIVLLASKSKKCIIYPGCATTIVPMYKNSFDNCILFKDSLNLF